MKAIVSIMAFGAAMSLLADGEAIYEIGPAKLDMSSTFTYVSKVDADGNFAPYKTETDTPLKAGDKIYFLVRLVALNDVATEETPGYYQLDHVGTGSETLDWIMRPPQIGIYVGKTRKAATMVQLPRKTPVSYDDPSAQSMRYVYDTVYEYAIEPGDLGLPIVLALKNGRPATVNDDAGSTGPSSEYLLPNAGAVSTDPWRVRYYEGSTTNNAVYTFNTGRQTAWQKPEKNYLFSNFSLTQCGFYAKTVDFSDRDEEVLEWRTVEEGNAQNGYIEIEDYKLFTTNKYNATLYVWAVDPAWTNNPSAATWVDAPAVALKGTTKSVTVGYDASGNAIKTNVTMATVSITEGKFKGEFTYEGIDKDKGKAVLVASSYDDFNWQTAGLDKPKLLSDYLTCGVTCVKAEPELKLECMDSAQYYMVTSNYTEKITTMLLKLTAGYPEDINVTVTPKLKTPGDYKWTDIVRVSEVDKSTAWKSMDPIKVTLTAGKKATVPIYVYGMGAPGQKSGLWEDSNGYLVEFDVTVDKGSEILKPSDSISLRPAAPVALTPAANEEITFTGGVSRELYFTVADNYTDKEDTNTCYKIYWRKDKNDTGGDDKKGYNLLKDEDGKEQFWRPDADGILRAFVEGVMTDKVPVVTYEDEVTDEQSSFYIVAPNTEKTAITTIVAKYKDPPAPKTVWPVAPKFDTTAPICSEGTNISVYAELSEAYHKKNTVYAFLQLADTNLYSRIRDTSNLAIEGARSFMSIAGGRTQSLSQTIIIDDGEKDGTTFEFDVVLCTTPKFSTNNVVKTFNSINPLYMVAKNVYPSLDEVTVGEETATPDENGDIWLTTMASIGAKTRFSFVVSDPSERDLEAGGADAFQIQYTMKGGGTNVTSSIYGDPNTNTLEFTFTTKDDKATLTLWTFDKDMKNPKQQVKNAVKRTVHFTVSDRPYVQVTTAGGALKGSFYEDKVGQDDGALLVNFLQGGGEYSANEPLTVQLTVKNATTGSKNPGALKLHGLTTPVTDLGGGVYTMTMLANQPSAEIYISSADGSADSTFSIVAKVTTTTLTPEGVRWCDFFADPAKTTQGTFTIRNQPPTLSVSLPMVTFDADGYFRGIRGQQNSSTNALIGVIGNNDPITWSVRDIVADMGFAGSSTNILVVWTSEGSNATTKVTDKSQKYTFVPVFKTGGKNKIVTVTVTDKDEETGRGTTSASWYYEVQESKTMTTLANGPSASESSLSQKYAAADGIGKGHIYSSAVISGAESHELTWNCGLSKIVNCYAWGYKVGDVDNGWLASGQDVALTANGNKTDKAASKEVKSGYYQYDDTTLDSFLYCWLQKVSQTTTSESGSGTTSSSSMISTIFGTLTPERTLAAATKTQVSLPTEEDKEGGYSPIMLEAIFSKEWLPADNMGDINADGIPDAYVSRYKFDVLDSSGSVADDADDLARLDSYNEDGDYLPNIGSAAMASFIPALSNTWVVEGREFTAKLEIRGWGTNLNDAVGKPYVKIANVKPDVKTDDAATTTFSPLEWDAFVQAGKPADWSPERPTDPTMLDTDDDGLPDGYEYYIWYKATVGYWDNDTHDADAMTATDGVHKYLTGRRYNPAEPGNPTVITPADIAAKFDPLTPLGEDYDTMDTDWDGIPDAIEFEIGTNPMDYDTDGDGLPDGYEVIFTNTDPLKADSNGNGTSDADENDDNDTMAVYEEEMDVIGVKSGSTTAYYCCLATNFTTQATVAKNTCTCLEVWYKDANNKPATNYVFTTATVKTYEANGKQCLIGDLEAGNTWNGRMVGGQLRQGTPVRIARGTLFDAVKADQAYYEEKVVANPAKYFTAFPYNGGIARGRAATASLSNQTVLVSYPAAKPKVKVMHYHVYQTHPYDPRTGWFHAPTVGSVESAGFTHMDEFLTMVFWHNVGTIPADKLVPTVDRTMLKIWTEFTTHPLNADSDDDRMPDGWELYLMADRARVSKSTGQLIPAKEAAPDSKYSPLSNFNKLSTQADRDPDTDALEWPQEFGGITSSARYGWTPSYPQWRNKTMPTDPWEADTDGDGVLDAYEGGINPPGGSSWEAQIVAANFMYNTSGSAGGGLNPLSWDTDSDGLPDPWEIEFHGTYKAGSTETVTYEQYTAPKSTATGANATTVTVTQVVGVGATWNMDGMDGTVPDARLDYDADGLANWQEYMVGSMRCWRYDDIWSGWGLHRNTFLTQGDLALGQVAEQLLPDPGTEEWNTFWYERLVDRNNASGNYNPNLANGYFDPGVYFSCCTNAFDGAKGKYYMFRDGVYHNLADSLNSPAVYWGGTDPDLEYLYDYTMVPKQYICCDPTKYDTDYDGMDDYYELFHGMNPLLGEPDELNYHYNNVDQPYDVVYDAYAHVRNAGTFTLGGPSALVNWWRNGINPHRPANVKNDAGYDFIAHPWLNGIAGADPDGDNIVNQEESIMPNVQAASTYHHSDPTPLWTTDSSYTNSLTRRYYLLSGYNGYEDTSSWSTFASQAHFKGPDGAVYNLADFPGFKLIKGLIPMVSFSYSINQWGSGMWAFSFEENEGYDSDHDFLSDYEEAQGKTKSASDMLDHDDPLRRQAMYFGGRANPSLLQTPIASDEQEPCIPAGSEARQNFLYYTVECWAKPDASVLTTTDGSLYAIVQRTIWADLSGPADERLLRRNFMIGVRDGKWYTCFDGSSTDEKQTVEITDGVQATTNWTHVAATYDGTELKLYVNGTCQGGVKPTGVQPEHGLQALAVSKSGEMNPLGGSNFQGYYITLTVGASPITQRGIVYDHAWRGRSYLNMTARNPLGLASQAKFDRDYGNYFKGYVDEVRVWDGARSASDILSDCENRVRYTAELAAENREAVFAKWKQGGLRSPASSVQLPAQLMYHFAFDHVAGAILPEDVIKVPAGFDTAGAVTDAKARWVRPSDWTESCWSNTAVKSTVYTDNSYVPWINNTVSHLPRFDLTTLDSVYWSEDYSGDVPAITNGYASFSFPRSNEVYSRWSQQTYDSASIKFYDSHYDRYFEKYNLKPGTTTDYSYTQKTRWNAITGYESAGEEATNQVVTSSNELTQRLQFARRDRNLVGDDMLPLGGAYPRRIGLGEGGMWDSKPGEATKASDAWLQTGTDADNNGLPDWWEEYARANYCEGLPPETPLELNTTVTYYGVSMTALQAYQRDIAKGLVKKGDEIEYDPDFVDKRDTDADGMPDWWEDMFGLDATSSNADEDPDNDGLSNFQEYTLREVYPLAYGLTEAPYGVKSEAIALNPTLTYSKQGQKVPDYFLNYSKTFMDVGNSPSHFFLNEYFGEIVTDHDFMEDWWENQYDISYTSSKKYDSSDDKDGDGWSTWAECRSSLWGGYFAANLIDQWSGALSNQYVQCYPQPIVGVKATYYGKRDISGKQLVIRTTSRKTQRTDATFVVPPTLEQQTRFIGGFYGDNMLHGHLSPGHINVNSIVFDRARVSNEKVYVWNCNWYVANAPEEAGWELDDDYYYRSKGGYIIWSECSRTHTGTFAKYREELAKWPKIQLQSGDLTWESFVITVPSADLLSAKMLIDGITQFGSIDGVTGEYVLNMDKFTGEGSADEYVFRVSYQSRLGNEWPQTVYLSDTRELTNGEGSGYVREGKNTIEAFMDLDENGAYTAGEPYGVVQNVDVGWHKTPVVTIELKDTSHVVPRFDVSANTDDRTVVEGSVGSGSTEKGDASSEDETGLTKTIRIRRVSVNDDKTVTKRTLATKTLVLDSRSYLSEADVLAAGKFDLDCKWLVQDWKKLGYDREDIEKATYEISEVLTDVNGESSNIVLKTFVNTFKTQRTIPATVAPLDDAPVYANSPTFTFVCDDETMTAYRLQIRRAGDRTATNLVYDSGITLLPGREPYTADAAVRNVTPDIHMGLGGLDDGNSYEWRVALYNAKFPDDEEMAWSAKTGEEWAKFQMDVDNKNRYPNLPTGYGRKSLAVRYYGPATNLTADTAIYVEAFEGADFRGQPMARAKVTLDAKLEALRSQDDITTTNALLKGLAPGKCFVRAFIDFNGNGKRDDWESWGYVNNVGKGVRAIYNPVEITVTSSTADWQLTDEAQYTLFIEDCDTNKNEIPDCMEQVYQKDSDGDGLSDEDEISLYGTDPYTADSDDDGMPDGYEVWADLDPNSPDSDIYEEGDVMAMALAEDGETVLRHAQVYAAYGFDATTAVSADGANTVPFTAIEKYGVIGYLDELGLIAYDRSKYSSGEAYVNANGLWDQYALKGGVSDLDGDGIPDGWELYVMFGPNGTNGVDGLKDVKISPWDKADGAKTSPGDAAAGLDEDSRLTLLGEFEGDKATDPWVTDTDGDNVIDRYYHDYMLWDAGEDPDGDGLSNYAEYLISKVFRFAELDPNNPKTNGSCVDYFRKEGELYYGEMFTDHDLVDDIWEQGYGDYANRYVYDPSRDDDGDGWCNYSEARAGTHPGAVASPGVDDNVLAEYPIPTIEAKVVYSGKQTLSGSLVFQAWGKGDADMSGVPDAQWTVSSENVATNVAKYAGQNPGKAVTYRLGPGVVSRGSVKVYFLDTMFEKAKIVDGIEAYSYRGEVGDARWYNFIQDYNGDLYTTAITNGVLSLASVQVKVGTVDYTTGELTIDFSNPALQQCIYQNTVNGSSSGTDAGTNSSGVYYSHEKLDLGRSFVKLEWKPVMISTTGNATYCLADATGGKGHVREGMNKFVVFCDLDGNGKYTAGEPFGFVRGVDVGWQGGSFSVQLTETSPVFARIDLRAAAGENASDREVWQEGDSTVMDISPDDSACNAIRKAIGVTCKDGDEDLDLSTTRKTRIRVMRVMVNGQRMLGYDDWDHEITVKQVVLDKYLDLGTRSYLHEGDFITGSDYDADWSTLPNLLATKARVSTNAKTYQYIDVTNVTYAIAIGEGDISGASSNLVFRCLVTKTFDYAGSRLASSAATHVIRPVIDTTVPQDHVYGARPTFRFAMKDGYDTVYNSYTAFKIRITGEGVTYETGLRDLPPRDETGWYEWTLDEAIGAKLPASGEYAWQVALYNAKFQGDKYQTTAVTEWSTAGAFTVNMNNQQPMNDHGYSSIATAVKYAGPECVLEGVSSCTYCGGEAETSKVIVQAFATADFAGAPMGQSYVTDMDEIADTSHNTANAAIRGLPQNGTYWLRAFIDSNGNGVKDDFESWGAAKEPVTLTADVVTMPTVGIYIEDADTDGDWIPDAYEYVKKGDLTTLTGKIIGGDQIVFSGTVGSTGSAGVSTGLSGASLTIFQNKWFTTTDPKLLELDWTVSIDAIRNAVEGKVNPNTVKITALTLDPNGNYVTLSMAAEVSDSIAGTLLGTSYNLSSMATATVIVKVYKKDTLATADWTLVCTKLKVFDRNEQQIDVPVTGVDMKSGFYKIEVVQ